MKTRTEFTIKSEMATTTAVSPTNKKRLTALVETSRQPFAIGLFVGIVFGLVVLGWWVFPVQWTDVPFDLLGAEEKAQVLDMASDLNAYNPQSEPVSALAGQWSEIVSLACEAAQTEPDQVRRIQLLALAYRINGQGCIK